MHENGSFDRALMKKNYVGGRNQEIEICFSKMPFWAYFILTKYPLKLINVEFTTLSWGFYVVPRIIVRKRDKDNSYYLS